MVSIANASSLFGRLTSGFLADRLGAMNVLIPYTLVTAVLTYAWPYATSTGTYAVVALLYGSAAIPRSSNRSPSLHAMDRFTCGAYVALLLSPMAQMGETADIGRRIGMLTTILACGALAGPPISGAIRASTGSFKPVGAYAGTSLSIIYDGREMLMLSAFERHSHSALLRHDVLGEMVFGW